MSILGNIQKVDLAVEKDRDGGTPPGMLGKQIRIVAVDAITKGIKSDEWKSYMSLFADNTAQLARLTEPQDKEPSYLPLMRAYVLSNFLCDIGTNRTTVNRLDERIDEGLDEASDGKIVRPFAIPVIEG